MAVLAVGVVRLDSGGCRRVLLMVSDLHEFVPTTSTKPTCACRSVSNTLVTKTQIRRRRLEVHHSPLILAASDHGLDRLHSLLSGWCRLFIDVLVDGGSRELFLWYIALLLAVIDFPYASGYGTFGASARTSKGLLHCGGGLHSGVRI